jgi:hypothetical protein
MDFPSFLHMQRQSTAMTFLFLRLSKIRIFPRAIVCPKKLTLDGTFILQMIFQANDEPDGVDDNIW